MSNRYGHDKGRASVSLNVTASETGGGAPNLSYPYAGDEFGIVVAAKYLPHDFTWEIRYGTPGNIVTVQIDLEGSLDGVNWFSLDSYAGTSNAIRFVTDKPVIYVRISIVSLDLTSGTSTTVYAEFAG